MTLRRRLLLVYLIVVLLSVATVGIAVLELEHARKLFQELQDWNQLVLKFDKLKSSWPPPPDADPEEFDLRDQLAHHFLYLASEPVHLDVERVRAALSRVYRQYELWRKSSPSPEATETDQVRVSLDRLASVIENELDSINTKADFQRLRTQILLRGAICLTIVHVLVIGSLLRRWLLNPLEQLNRQVEALGRDEPPRDPLLQSPRELARLAQTLDRARQSLGDMRQRLLENERLTTIGQFAAQLAHNLRNPLASIRATAQVASKHTRDDDTLQARMNEIVRSVDRLNQWIAGLMEVARSRPQNIQCVDIVPTLQRVRQAVEPEIRIRQCELELDAPQDGLRCRHDPATLEHALIAIVLNAIEASPPSGTITVKALTHTAPGKDPNGDPCVTRRTDDADGDKPANSPPPSPHSDTFELDPTLENAAGTLSHSFCRVSVLDEGPGLPAENPECIFDSSYSTKQHGMGLGLALARQVLERQGGIVRAGNKPGGGAVISVDLPMPSA